ncbi:DUF2637 domain-containing protein [Streptomyces sp. NPDC048297]|uniref:DUF2637 domain-containing protein n=1 Tax=Streptomyces sp. NPDC048297 TaxID=3365531 RepID=UPI0037214454
MAAPLQLTRLHRILIGVVVSGALIIAGIGFAGSYAAVRELALKKGFGNFSYVFPIGIDAGICVLLALDLLLTWIRIPFPLLRQTAWLLTAATIAFNGAAAWPDPLGVGMHAVIPILFVVSVEAARHAIGRIADITADKHMEGVRITRWLLSPVPTFLLWRRMKLWELRSYEQVIKLEQERLVYQARLRSRFGRAWRRKAPVESLMPLRLARYGVPLAQTAPAGLAAAGVDPQMLPAAPEPAVQELEEPLAAAVAPVSVPDAPSQWFAPQGEVPYGNAYDPEFEATLATAEGGQAAEVTRDLAGDEESFEEGFLQGGPEDDGQEWADMPLWPDADHQLQTQETERYAVHASGLESGGRSVVQARVPKARDEAEPDAEFDAEEPASDSRESEEERQAEPEDGSHLTGPARVEFHYRQLPLEEQERSAKALAPILAERCGYREGTVRKYLGEIKRAASV